MQEEIVVKENITAATVSDIPQIVQHLMNEISVRFNAPVTPAK